MQIRKQLSGRVWQRTSSHYMTLVFFVLAAYSTQPSNAQDFPSLPVQKDYTQERVSSSDPTGRNDDGNWKNPIKAGEERTIANLTGPGVITHIWFTIAAAEHYHLKKIVLRLFWDDDQVPAVESPVGDFFGLGLGEYFVYESGPLSVGSQKALNCYFPMPFRHSARVTITNDGKEAIQAFYYNIDWQKHESLPDNLLYFYAEYGQAQPNQGWTDDWKANSDPKVDGAKNKDGHSNYVMFEAEGPGHYIGVTQSIIQNQGEWWGEGDDMMFIDDDKTPHILGTGSEDYFLGAWDFGGHPFAYALFGAPVVGSEVAGGRSSVYRFHLDSPIPFSKFLRATIEHGHANVRSDNYFSVAYWYQTEPHASFPALPALEQRIPRIYPVGGPGNAGK